MASFKPAQLHGERERTIVYIINHVSVVVYRNLGEILGKNSLHSAIQNTRVLNRDPLET